MSHNQIGVEISTVPGTVSASSQSQWNRLGTYYALWNHKDRVWTDSMESNHKVISEAKRQKMDRLSRINCNSRTTLQATN
jgi:hypothetical protein